MIGWNCVRCGWLPWTGKLRVRSYAMPGKTGSVSTKPHDNLATNCRTSHFHQSCSRALPDGQDRLQLSTLLNVVQCSSNFCPLRPLMIGRGGVASETAFDSTSFSAIIATPFSEDVGSDTTRQLPRCGICERGSPHLSVYGSDAEVPGATIHLSGREPS